jgi:hypothetical protein
MAKGHSTCIDNNSLCEEGATLTALLCRLREEGWVTEKAKKFLSIFSLQ